MLVFRYLARSFLVALLASLVGMCGLFLIVDFADRAKLYTGEGWLSAVLELYAMKAIQSAYQLTPAALALGAAIAMSALRRRGEVTALRALGRGPATFAWPIGVVACAVGVGLMAAEDPVVVRANYRAEELTVTRFHRWGDWAAYHWNRRWFRGKNNRVYYLGRIDDTGFADVAIYDLSKDFKLKRRIDAKRIERREDGAWVMRQAVTRTFPADGPMIEAREDERVERFPEDINEFRVKTGRPSQLRRRELPGQIAIRQKLGLPSREWELALHERRAYQLTGIPAALMGAALALRPRRRGHLTAAIAEGFAVTIALWVVSVLARTLALSGQIPPEVGGWLPTGVAVVGAIFAVRLAR